MTNIVRTRPARPATAGVPLMFSSGRAQYGKRFPGRPCALAVWLGLLFLWQNAWAASAPAIATQPMNQAAAAGGTVNLSITATGDAPLTYQWLKDGRFILGATNSTLT